MITVRVNWLMGEEHLDPPWSFGPEGQRFEAALDAEPPVASWCTGSIRRSSASTPRSG